MSQSKPIITLLIPFLVSVGCGQAFEAHYTKLQRADQNVNASNLNVPAGKTPKSKDQEILNKYMSEFSNLDSQNIEDITGDIRSFEVELDRQGDTIKNISLKMHARTRAVDTQGTSITACRNLIEVRKSNIPFSEMESQEAISIGRSSGYEFIIQCTDSPCDEMVAAVRRSGNNPGLVLIGLMGKAPNGSGNSYTRKYVSRYVDIDTYFTVAVTPDEYVTQVCAYEENNDNPGTVVDPNPPGNLFGEPPTENDPVDPTEGDNNPTEPEEKDDDKPFWYDVIGDLF